jgi:hypothetical protein
LEELVLTIEGDGLSLLLDLLLLTSIISGVPLITISLCSFVPSQFSSLLVF